MEKDSIVKKCYDAISNKKAEDVKIIDVSKICIMYDYLIIASGNNKNQIQAIADNVCECLHKNDLNIKSIEGYEGANWILIDAFNLVIHIFDKESRSFYDLERLYQDGEKIYFD